MKSRYLSEAELTALFSQLAADRRLLFEVALQTGMRIGDVVKLRRRNISRVGSGEVRVSFTAEKTGKHAICPIYGTYADKLWQLAKHGKGFLWPSRGKTGHITRQSAWNWLKAAAKAANVDFDGVSPHSLRKCFAVRVRHERGMLAAQRALQHSNSATTAIYAYADIYAGEDPEAPVLWCQVDQLVDLIAARLTEHAKELS